MKQAILFMKMEELRAACRDLGLPMKGQKRDLIARIVGLVQRVTIPETTACRKPGKAIQAFTPGALMRPETYTNGAASRVFLRKEIGNHFRFTTFGMDWLKQQWSAGQTPTFAEFIQFWKQEYEDRAQGKAFTSKPELARVNFFRSVTRLQKLTKAELERLWKEERLAQARKARELLERYLKSTAR